MRLAINIERHIKNIYANKLQVTTSADLDERVLANVTDTLEELKRKKSAAIRPNTWRLIMKSRITKLAAIAAIVVLLFCIFEFAGSFRGTGVAWAGVAERVEQAHTVIYRVRRSATSGPKQEGFEFIEPDRENIIYLSSTHGMRTDSYQKGQFQFSIYALPKEKSIVSVLHYAKEYTRHPLPGGEFGGADPRRIVKQIMSNEYIELGRKEIDAMQVEGVELKGQKISGERLEDAVTRLWVDVQTGYPVRMELEGVAYGKSTKVKVVQDLFQWNPQLGPSVFEPNIPADYILVEGGFDSNIKPAQAPTIEETFPQLDLPDLNDLNLLGLGDEEPNATVPLVGMKQIWEAQDQIMATWPAYSDVSQRLYEELSAKLDVDNLAQQQRVATAVALREKFWQAGGCLSKVSYPYAYAARVLLELAHDDHPQDMAITDELVETIMSAEVVASLKPDSDERVRNKQLLQTLCELRSAQYEQIMREVQQGRTPVWEDFLRVCEYVILIRDYDIDAAQQAAEWLISQAQPGGWSAYLQPLKGLEQSLIKGEHYGFNVSVATKIGFPEDIRYARRLPSFKGPKKRGTTPIHLRVEKPVWHGH